MLIINKKYKVTPIYIKIGNLILYKNEILTILQPNVRHTRIFRHLDRREYVLPTSTLKLTLEVY